MWRKSDSFKPHSRVIGSHQWVAKAEGYLCFPPGGYWDSFKLKRRVRSIVIWDCLLVSVNGIAVNVNGLSKAPLLSRLLDDWMLGCLGVDGASYLGPMTGKTVSVSESEVKFDLHLEFSVFLSQQSSSAASTTSIIPSPHI